jgi:hypothetical protein
MASRPAIALPAGVVRSSASVKRDEPDIEVLQFLERHQQIRYEPAPAIQPPYQHHVDLAATDGLQYLLTRLSRFAPEFTSRSCKAIVHRRRAAYSRIARFCIASVC